MTDQEAKKEIAVIRRMGKEIRETPGEARKFLLKLKFITSSGRLAKRFRG